MSQSAWADDIYTEPKTVDMRTLANLGPLTPLAGVWEGTRGVDIAPKSYGARTQPYVERIELQPIDPALNGPQLFYGLRYHQFVTKPGQLGAYHDQVGFWLWEPATGSIIQSLAIPRGQVAMAVGTAAPDARTFELIATHGAAEFGILSNPFLDKAFKTTHYRIQVTIGDDGGWSYEEDTVLMLHGVEAFHHTDRSTLVKIAEPTPNPKARQQAGA